MNNFLRKYRTRYTTYNKLLEIESEDRVYLEKEIRNMNSFEGLFHPGISFIGSFIHSFIFFFFSLFPNNGVLSRNRVKPRSIYPRSIHHGYCLPPSPPSPRRARAILHSFDERGATLAHPLPISVSQLPRRRRHARCDRCALKLVSQLAYHDLDSIARENESASPSVSPLFPFRFPPLSNKGLNLKEERMQVRLRTEEFSNFSKSFLIFTRSKNFVRIHVTRLILIWIELYMDILDTLSG